MSMPLPQKEFYRRLLDGDLLARCREGDREAREDLARTCLPRVSRTVMLTAGGGQDMDDLVQTAMARIFSGLGSFREDRGEKGFLAWLDKVTINAVRQYYRRRPLDILLTNIDEAPLSGGTVNITPGDPPDLEQQVEDKRLLKKVAAHLDGIGAKKRIALILSAVYGYTSRESAELMDCSLETAKKRLQHGRRELLGRLKKDPSLCQALREIRL